MTAYAIDWEGAYDAWKQSGLPRRRFQYSEQFKSFIGEGGMPSEDTVRTRFRSIRDQRGDRYVAAVNSETEQRPVELDLSEPGKIFRLNEQKIQTTSGLTGTSLIVNWSMRRPTTPKLRIPSNKQRNKRLKLKQTRLKLDNKSQSMRLTRLHVSPAPRSRTSFHTLR